MAISEEEQMLAAGYVLGDLSPTETTEFQTVMAGNPDLQAEVAAMQVAFNKLPQRLDLIAPPPDLKAKIVDNFGVASTPSQAIASPTISQRERDANEREPIVISTPDPTTRSTFPWSKILGAIGLLISSLFAFDNFQLRQQLQIAQQVNQQELASVLNQPKSRLLALRDLQERVVGNVLFTPGNWQQVIVSAQNLPPLPVDKVYRMWLELTNGTVIPCGDFKTDANGKIFIKLNAQQNPPAGTKAKGVFVTIEGRNAPLQPTGDRVIQGTI